MSQPPARLPQPQILPQMASVVKKEVTNIELASIFNSIKSGVQTGVKSAVKAGKNPFTEFAKPVF